MIISSDWHIHCEASYDSKLPIKEIEDGTAAFGFEKFGITDHVNYNDKKFLEDLENSVKMVNDLKARCNRAVLGVELTPVPKPLFDHIAKNGTRDGYIPPVLDLPYEIELAVTKEYLKDRGVRYAIGAAHWRIDGPDTPAGMTDIKACIKEWHRQQLWLACDERVTILGHPWYHGKALWYEDFSIIPQLHKDELAAALKENGKFVECNSHFFNSEKTTEKFKRQYAEFLREMFEKGIPITYGSDAHNEYKPSHVATEKYLLYAGFSDGDILGLNENVLW